MFETAGTLFVGAILTVVFFVGLKLIFIAWIIQRSHFSLYRIPSNHNLIDR